MYFETVFRSQRVDLFSQSTEGKMYNAVETTEIKL